MKKNEIGISRSIRGDKILVEKRQELVDWLAVTLVALNSRVVPSQCEHGCCLLTNRVMNF
jgi:hypothetical protein